MDPITATVAGGLLSIIGGAVGATIAKSKPWIGGLVGLVFALTAVLVSALGVGNQLITFAACIIVSGILGGALGLTGRQLPTIVLGVILGSVIMVAIIDSTA